MEPPSRTTRRPLCSGEKSWRRKDRLDRGTTLKDNPAAFVLRRKELATQRPAGSWNHLRILFMIGIFCPTVECKVVERNVRGILHTDWAGVPHPTAIGF